MDIKQLRYFLALSRHGNMTRAAEEVFITQQAFSKAMRNFEEELGVALFDRSAQKLTEYGKCLLPYAKKAIRDVDAALDALSEMKKAKRHIIHMGYVVGSLNAQSALPPALVADWENAHPDTTVFTEEYTPVELAQMVLDEELDCAYTVYALPEEAQGIVTHVLTREGRCVLLREDHPSASKEALGFEDLRDMPLLAARMDDFPEREVLSAYQNAGYVPEIRFFNGSFSQCVERARIGDGIMIAGRAYCKAVHPQGLAIKPFPDGEQTITHALLYKKGRAFPEYMREFFRFIRGNARDLENNL